MNHMGTLEQAGPSAGRTTMRNSLLMGVTVSALSFVAVPASAQVVVDVPIGVRNSDAVPRSQDDAGERDDYDDDYGYESSYGPYRPAGFGVPVYGGGSANEYGPYGYPDRGYGVYAERGYRNGGSPLRAAFDYGRRDGYDAGIDAARYGRFAPVRHRYYRSTRGWDHRFGGRDAYDVNYRNGFRSGYEEGYRVVRRSRRW
jgi:hypothetical protein